MIARLIIGNSTEDRTKTLQQILEELGMRLKHPDLLFFDSEQKLGIEQARKIKEHFSFKPYQAKGRAVVIEEGSNLTLDAQNSLLKTLEELPKEAMFIIGAASEANFLPTVLSRVQVTRLDNHTENKDTQKYNQDIKLLESATIAGRFEFVEKLKDRESLLPALVGYFRQQVLSEQGKNSSLNLYLEELLQAETWAKQNVNIRAILEYLMLKMPQSKE